MQAIQRLGTNLQPKVGAHRNTISPPLQSPLSKEGRGVMRAGSPSVSIPSAVPPDREGLWANAFAELRTSRAPVVDIPYRQAYADGAEEVFEDPFDVELFGVECYYCSHQVWIRAFPSSKLALDAAYGAGWGETISLGSRLSQSPQDPRRIPRSTH